MRLDSRDNNICNFNSDLYNNSSDFKSDNYKSSNVLNKRCVNSISNVDKFNCKSRFDKSNMLDKIEFKNNLMKNKVMKFNTQKFETISRINSLRNDGSDRHFDGLIKNNMISNKFMSDVIQIEKNEHFDLDNYVIGSECNNDCTEIVTIEEMKKKVNKKINRDTHTLNVHNHTKSDNIYDINLDAFQYEIVYNKMGGRPSVLIETNNIFIHCLLDTGARMNVIDSSVIKNIEGVDIKSYDEGIWCANGSTLETLGRVKLKVKIGNREENITFVVVKKVSPSVIGGIELLKQFNIKLMKVKEGTYEDFNRNASIKELCSIEAGFGKLINDDIRFKKVIEFLNIRKENELYNIIKKNVNVFMADKWDIGRTNLIEHEIKTTEGPIRLNPRRQPAHLENKIEEAIKNLEENGIIRKCDSPGNTPLVCVWKKEKKDIRLCLDFRSLNKITERQIFPMPNIEQMLDSLNGSTYFSTIDLGSAYYQVKLTEKSQEKTAFSTRTGQYCFNRMPFGIAAAPATFQKLMNMVLGNALWKTAVVYLDDILIFSKTREEHMIRVNDILSRIKNAGLRVNPEKCIF